MVKALNGDPFIGMFETPVTSSPGVTMLLSNLPAYRTGVSPLLRGVEIGLTHGFFLTGPFIKLGPLRATESAEIAGSLSGAGLVLILTACLSIYGAVSFQQPSVVGVKTLTGVCPPTRAAAPLLTPCRPQHCAGPAADVGGLGAVLLRMAGGWPVGRRLGLHPDTE